jgi:hypothetical protein
MRNDRRIPSGTECAGNPQKGVFRQPVGIRKWPMICHFRDAYAQLDEKGERSMNRL